MEATIDNSIFGCFLFLSRRFWVIRCGLIAKFLIKIGFVDSFLTLWVVVKTVNTCGSESPEPWFLDFSQVKVSSLISSVLIQLLDLACDKWSHLTFILSLFKKKKKRIAETLNVNSTHLWKGDEILHKSYFRSTLRYQLVSYSYQIYHLWIKK